MKHLSLSLIISLCTYSLCAQCSLACFNDVVGELDTNCEYTPDVNDLLSDATTSCPGGVFTIEIFDSNGNLIPGSPTINESYFGVTLSYEITDNVTQTSCFGNITLEDNIAPSIICPAQAESECLPELLDVIAVITDNCTNTSSTLLPQSFSPYACDPDYVGENIVFIEATDIGGNTASCFSSVLLKRMDLSQIVFPSDFLLSGGTNLSCDDTIDPALTQFPSYLGVELNQGNYSDCNITVTYSDQIVTSSPCLIKTIRTWTIEELWCGSNVQETAVQVIEQTDETAPSISCIAGLSLNLNSSGIVIIDPSMIDGGSSDNCGGQITFTLSQTSFDCSNIGSNVVNLIATDDCGNSSSCFSTINIEDNDNICPPPAFLFVTGPIPINENFCAGEELESDSNPIMATELNFNAGESILLIPGFEIEIGTDFSANIGPCIN